MLGKIFNCAIYIFLLIIFQVLARTRSIIKRRYFFWFLVVVISIRFTVIIDIVNWFGPADFIDLMFRFMQQRSLFINFKRQANFIVIYLNLWIVKIGRTQSFFFYRLRFVKLSLIFTHWFRSELVWLVLGYVHRWFLFLLSIVLLDI